MVGRKHDKRRKSSRRRVKRHYAIYQGLVTFLVLLTSVGLIYWGYLAYKQLVDPRASQAEISNLYQDDQQVFLRSDISRRELDQAQNIVEDLAFWQKDPALSALQAAYEKYEAMNVLSSFYKLDQGLVDLRENNLDQYEVVEEVAAIDLVGKEETLFQSSDDRFNAAMGAQYNLLLTFLSELDWAKEGVKKLPYELDLDHMEEDLHVFQAFDFDGEDYLHQSQAQVVSVAYQERTEAYAASLLDQQEELRDRKGALDLVFSTEPFDTLLAGTPIDLRPLAALTFDDGPSPYTKDVVELLNDHDIVGTFFQLGQKIEEAPQISKAVADAGHIVANHSYSHPDINLFSNDFIINEFTKTQDIIEEVIGEATTIYRTPYGNGRNKMLELFPDWSPVYWNVDSEDWTRDDSDHTVDVILSSLEHRSIILLHDSLASTPETVARLIPALIDRGYAFVTPDVIPEADLYAVQ